MANNVIEMSSGVVGCKLVRVTALCKNILRTIGIFGIFAILKEPARWESTEENIKNYSYSVYKINLEGLTKV